MKNRPAADGQSYRLLRGRSHQPVCLRAVIGGPHPHRGRNYRRRMAGSTGTRQTSRRLCPTLAMARFSGGVDVPSCLVSCFRPKTRTSVKKLTGVIDPGLCNHYAGFDRGRRDQHDASRQGELIASNVTPSLRARHNFPRLVNTPTAPPPPRLRLVDGNHRGPGLAAAATVYVRDGREHFLDVLVGDVSLVRAKCCRRSWPDA